MKTMKSNALLSLILATCLSLFCVSCSDDSEDESVIATGIVMDQDSLAIEVGAASALVATLEPTGATGDITWTSSDASVATVTNGIITGISVGEATIVAASGVFSTTAIVTVSPKALDPNDLPASLQGSDYYIIQIDETSYSAIEDKVNTDLRPDDIEGSKNLYIWNETFSAGTTSGLNVYGQTEGWVSLIVGSVGWSGGGYNVGALYEGNVDMTNLYTSPEDYVFHIAFKSDGTSSYLLKLSDATSEVSICIGSASYTDNDVAYAPYADFARDNEWHEIEIPVTELNELGLFYNASFKDTNVLTFLAGGVAGTKLEMDAMFFYKKSE